MADRQPPRSRPTWLAEQLFPYESRFIDIEGCQVHYVDEGSGPTLLFLHGSPTWSFLYRHLIGLCRERYRCIALDWPGFGLSTASTEYGYGPDEHAHILERFLEALGLEEVVLMGHDWGGPIGLYVAQRRPERFAGFILANTFAWPIEGNWRLELLSKVTGGSVGGALIRHWGLLVTLALGAGTRERLPAAVKRCYRRPFTNAESRVPIHVLARELTGANSFLHDVERGLSRLVDCPTLLVWGEQDPFFGAAERMRFEERLPGHELILLPTARHFVQEDDPEIIAQGIDEWAGLALTHFA